MAKASRLFAAGRFPGTSLVFGTVLAILVLGGDRVHTVGTPIVTAIDLGTLGGAASEGAAINAAGDVAGTSQLVNGHLHAFFWSAPTGMIDLGTLGGPESRAFAINEHGQVVGTSMTADFYDHAFSWTLTGGMIDLGGGMALDVNASGQVVGNAGQGAFSWTPSGGRIAIPRTFWGTSASAVNNSGEVVGARSINAVAAHAFIWTSSDGMLDLGAMVDGPVASTAASAVNVRGQVAGVGTGPRGDEDAFLWSRDRGFEDIGAVFGFIQFGANHRGSPFLNGRGQVAGTILAGHSRAFIWASGGAMRDLGTLGGPSSTVTGINDLGQVIGYSEYQAGQEYHAFAWSDAGGMLDLGTFGGRFSTAYAVNNHSQIVGGANLSGDLTEHAVRWQVNLPAQILTTLMAAAVNAGFQQASRLLQNALASLDKADTNAACNQIGAFMNQVQAQRGKSLPTALADQWLSSATQLRAAIGCR